MNTTKPINGNVISFDFGTKNIGVAVGQFVTCTAHPLRRIKRNKLINWKEIESLIKEWNPVKIVVGLPLDCNGKEQFPLSKKVRNFSKEIFNIFNIQVFLHDERFSTVEARHRLFSYGGYKLLKEEKINSNSASIILEGWFETFSKKIIC